MRKLNCWEFKKCGREPGGAHASELGICPASLDQPLDGSNHGKNGGRVCWHVAGTCCGGQVQGTFAAKIVTCLTQCTFYGHVRREEGDAFEDPKALLSRLKTSKRVP